jgi:hypothetical protein
VPITNSVKTLFPGMGSSSVSYTLNGYTAAASAATLACPMGTLQTTPPATGQVLQTGSTPVRRGMVRVKTDAAVASFLVTAISGKDAGGVVYVLYHGDVATALAGIASAVVDQYYHFNSDVPLTEIDVAILPGAAVNISLEVVGGA